MTDETQPITGDVIEITPDACAYGGAAVGRVSGKVVMVSGAIPGESVRARIDEDKPDYMKATAVDILSPSIYRTEPACPYYADCGGCDYQFITPEGQRIYKNEVLKYTLRKIGKIEIEPEKPLTGEGWNYRHRAQFKCDGGSIGFYREGTREVVDIESCPVMMPKINSVLERVRKLDMSGVGELHISLGLKPVGMVIPAKGHGMPPESLVNKLLDAGLAGLTVHPKDGKPAVHGEPRFGLNLSGIRYEVSAPSFFQTNWEVNLKLVGLVLERLWNDGKRGRLLDLYCGAGNFSLPLADIFEEVVGVEESPFSISDAKHNASINGIENCRFIRSDAESLRPVGEIDALVTDPPRPGLTKAALAKVVEMRPRLIAYVSCNPATFARDLNRLVTAGYEVESVRTIDFFPQTHHIESVAFLKA